MNRKHRMTVAVVAFAAIAPTLASPARATEPFAKIVFQINGSPLATPRSARNQAIGGAGVADPTTPANAVYNPANLVGDDGVFAFYDHHRLYDMADVYDAGISAARTWSGSGVRGAVAVRQVFQRYDPVIVRTVYVPEGSTFQADDRGTGVATAVSVPVGGARLAVGAGVEHATMQFAADNTEAWAFDGGALVSMPFQDARGDRYETHVGLSLLNAGNGFEFGSVQSESHRQVRAGLGARYASSRTVPAPFSARVASVATLSVAVDLVLDDPAIESPTALAGFEVGLLETIFLRAGTGGQMGEQGDGASYGAGLAVGYGPIRLHADVAVYPSRSSLEDTETLLGLALDYRP